MHSHGVVLLLLIFQEADLLGCVCLAAREVTEDGLVHLGTKHQGQIYLLSLNKGFLRRDLRCCVLSGTYGDGGRV